MKKFVCAVVALALVAALSTSAFAQRDAGAKARGSFGRGFWNSSRSTGTNYNYYTPSYSATQTYRSYSYQPIGIQQGDKVKVNADDVKLMDGRRVVTKVDKGLEFKVEKVTRGWLKAEFKQDGKQRVGWIWHKNVNLESDAN